MDIQNNKAALRAAKRLQRRRERNKPSDMVLDILKQSREAAGLPLNAVNIEQVIPPETAHESPDQIMSANLSVNNDKDKTLEKQDTVVAVVVVEPDWDDRNGYEVIYGLKFKRRIHNNCMCRFSNYVPF